MFSNEQLIAIYGSKIGFEFEFFSNYELQITRKSIADTLNKKIVIEEKAHSDFSPDENTFKLEPDNSGGTGMIELVTGALPFVESKIILAKTLKWIQENGSTNDRCSIHINVSFDGKKLGTSTNIQNLDIGKFVLNFNENKVFELFPDREHSVYAKSIKFILPLSGMTQNSSGKFSWRNYMFVNEKYYGINFAKIPKGYLEFRYIGGKDYEKKYNSILSLTEHFILSIYDTLVNPKYSEDDILKLDAVLEQYKNIVKSYNSYAVFKELNPNIKLMVDLKTSSKIIEMYYPKIRESLFNLLTKADMKEGIINYDSDIGKIQIKDANLMRCFEINNVDIVDCKIQGTIRNCDVFNSEIINSSVFMSNLFGSTDAKSSKIEDSYVSRYVKCDDCYVFGKRGVFSGDMKGGIFRIGRATKFAVFSDDTEIIEIEKI